MLGRDVLVFPDTGEDFVRTLRTAALCAGRVHCLTFVAPRDKARRLGSILEEVRRRAGELAGHKEHALSRFQDYAAFLRDNPDLWAAKEAGVLQPLQESTIDAFLDSVKNGMTSFAESSVCERRWSPMARKLARAAYKCPPSLFDLEMLTLPEHSVLDFDLVLQALFLKYLLGLIVLAETKALTLTSWSPEFRNVIWDCRRLIGDSEFSPQGRSAYEARIAQVVFERRLSRVDDLPLEEVLRIRERRQEELEAFRIGVAVLAAKVDTTQSRELIDRQISDLVSTHIDPAVRKLRAAVAASRLDSLKRVFRRSWTAIAAKATLPAILAYSVGKSIEFSAVVAALGAVALPFAEAEIDRRKLLSASEWSLLLRFK